MKHRLTIFLKSYPTTQEDGGKIIEQQALTQNIRIHHQIMDEEEEKEGSLTLSFFFLCYFEKLFTSILTHQNKI